MVYIYWSLLRILLLMYWIYTKVWFLLHSLLIGEFTFTTTSAIKIYVILQIDYISSLIQKFELISVRVLNIKILNVKSIPIEEEMFLNRMITNVLLESDGSAEIQVNSVWLQFKAYKNGAQFSNFINMNFTSRHSVGKKFKISRMLYYSTYSNQLVVSFFFNACRSSIQYQSLLAIGYQYRKN